jgi:HAD superfamily hydrolase (TIGR01509 family)
MTEAIIFDCFGVIISDALKLFLEQLRANGRGAEADQVTEIVRANNRGIIMPADSNQQIADLLGITVDDYRSHIDQKEVKNTQLLDYILELRKTYKTALLSNIGIGSLNRRFAPGELDRYFDTVVVSGDIGHIKPEPEAYEIAAIRINAHLKNCIFIDDRTEYCAGAQAVGMQAICYISFDQFKAELESLLKGNAAQVETR